MIVFNEVIELEESVFCGAKIYIDADIAKSESKRWSAYIVELFNPKIDNPHINGTEKQIQQFVKICIKKYYK